jgi:hypothetical protein
VAGKGGSELPGPIQVVTIVMRDSVPGKNDSAPASSAVMSGLKWRIWEQQGSELLARSSAVDSAGRLSIPNQSGIWVLEGWRDSLPSRVPVAVSLTTGIPDTCIDSVSSSVSFNASHNCKDLASPTLATGILAAARPAGLAVVRLRDGLPSLRLRFADSVGTPIAAPAMARLWTVIDGDSLAFAGELRRDAEGYLRMPRPRVSGPSLLEMWPANAPLPNEVVARQAFPSGRFFRYMNCREMPGMPSGDVPVTLHTCQGLGTAPSLLGHLNSASPTMWAAFEFLP